MIPENLQETGTPREEQLTELQELFPTDTTSYKALIINDIIVYLTNKFEEVSSNKQDKQDIQTIREKLIQCEQGELIGIQASIKNKDPENTIKRNLRLALQKHLKTPSKRKGKNPQPEPDFLSAPKFPLSNTVNDQYLDNGDKIDVSTLTNNSTHETETKTQEKISGGSEEVSSPDTSFQEGNTLQEKSRKPLSSPAGTSTSEKDNLHFSEEPTKKLEDQILSMKKSISLYEKTITEQQEVKENAAFPSASKFPEDNIGPEKYLDNGRKTNTPTLPSDGMHKSETSSLFDSSLETPLSLFAPTLTKMGPSKEETKTTSLPNFYGAINGISSLKKSAFMRKEQIKKMEEKMTEEGKNNMSDILNKLLGELNDEPQNGMPTNGSMHGAEVNKGDFPMEVAITDLPDTNTLSVEQNELTTTLTDTSKTTVLASVGKIDDLEKYEEGKLLTDIAQGIANSPKMKTELKVTQATYVQPISKLDHYMYTYLSQKKDFLKLPIVRKLFDKHGEFLTSSTMNHKNYLQYLIDNDQIALAMIYVLLIIQNKDTEIKQLLPTYLNEKVSDVRNVDVLFLLQQKPINDQEYFSLSTMNGETVLVSQTKDDLALKFSLLFNELYKDETSRTNVSYNPGTNNLNLFQSLLNDLIFFTVVDDFKQDLKLNINLCSFNTELFSIILKKIDLITKKLQGLHKSKELFIGEEIDILNKIKILFEGGRGIKSFIENNTAGSLHNKVQELVKLIQPLVQPKFQHIVLRFNNFDLTLMPPNTTSRRKKL